MASSVVATRRIAPVSTEATSIHIRPPSSALKTMLAPSGDHRGASAIGARNEESCRGFPPSLSAIQISSLPVRLETKAILLPSGENSGAVSYPVEKMIFVGRGIPLDRGFTTLQIFAL